MANKQDLEEGGKKNKEKPLSRRQRKILAGKLKYYLVMNGGDLKIAAAKVNIEHDIAQTIAIEFHLLSYRYDPIPGMPRV